MRIYIVYENISPDKHGEGCNTLMEVFDSRKKANAYIREKKKEPDYEDGLHISYEIIVRKLL